MSGLVNVLNVGAGDMKLSFDKNNPAEAIRAARVVKDMIRRGFALLVEIERDGEKVFVRANDFDENTQEYIIADFDPTAPSQSDAGPLIPSPSLAEIRREQPDGEEESGAAETATAPSQKTGKASSRRRLPANKTRAVAVGRSAGG